MEDEQKKRANCVGLIACLFCFPILAGIGCLIAYFVISTIKTCQSLCGEDYTIQDDLGNCCYSINKNCIEKSSCGNLQTLWNIGIYLTVASILVCCCIVGIFAPKPKRNTDYYVAVQPKKKKYIHAIIQVEE